ncbi:hypothetical protein DFH28DRAFT_842426, partial [Melampsora americana]
VVNLYNQTYTPSMKPHSDVVHKGRYNHRLRANVASLRMDIHCVKENYDTCGVCLTASATGVDNKRFCVAMPQHSKWLNLEGSSFSAHMCSTCTEDTSGSNQPVVTHHTVQKLIVTDRITLRIWGCSASQKQPKVL